MEIKCLMSPRHSPRVYENMRSKYLSLLEFIFSPSESLGINISERKGRMERERESPTHRNTRLEKRVYSNNRCKWLPSRTGNLENVDFGIFLHFWEHHLFLGEQFSSTKSSLSNKSKDRICSSKTELRLKQQHFKDKLKAAMLDSSLNQISQKPPLQKKLKSRHKSPLKLARANKVAFKVPKDSNFKLFSNS